MAECGIGHKAEVKFNRDKTFLCIDYPAVVKNPDKMLETLGGEKRVSEVYSDPQLRLPLRFRPSDVHCKSTYGDRMNTTRLLLKIRRKKVRPSNASAAGAESCTSEILGIVDQTYKFKSLVDFQYLPMEKVEGGGYTSIVDKLVPSHMHQSSWLREESPLFLPPAVFSRIDNPCEYHYRKEPIRQKSSGFSMSNVDDYFSRNRQKRTGYSVFANYDDTEVPAKPHEDAFELLSMKSCTKHLIAQIRQAFEERPIWSRHALLSKVEFGYRSQLKYVLPAVAYLFSSGPWRSLWVRFGYDPRIKPEAKIYQLLDFRIRRHIGREKVPVGGHKPGFNTTPSPEKDPSDLDSSYMFAEGVRPPRRQMFYQLCDISLPEVQKLIHDNDGHETKCTEKDGWCNANIPEKCRNIMMAHVEQVLSAQEGHEPKETDTSHILDQSSDLECDEDQSSDDSSTDGFSDMLEGMRTLNPC